MIPERQRIEHEIEEAVCLMVPDPEWRKVSCLYYALAATAVLQGAGHRVKVLAGTAIWNMGTDGHYGYVCPRHFPMGSRFDEVEIHVWVGLPDLRLFMDAAAWSFPAAAAGKGYGWDSPRPPRVAWWRHRGPVGALYEPTSNASLFAATHMLELAKGMGLRPTEPGSSSQAVDA